MKFKHETWRKLYIREVGSFARLPLFARALAAEVLKLCDDAGRIEVGEKDLASVIAFRLGATTSDRRLLRTLVPLLEQDGYLVRRGPYYVVRNFVAAQRDWRHERTEVPTVPPLPAADVPRADTGVSGARVDHEPSLTRASVVHEMSPNDAKPLDPDGRSDLIRVDLSEGDGERARDPVVPALAVVPAPDPPPPPRELPRVQCPTVEYPNALDPSEALDELAKASGDALRITSSLAQRVELRDHARTAEPPLTLEDFRRIGRAYAAKAICARMERKPDARFLLANGAAQLMALAQEARDWEQRAARASPAKVALDRPPVLAEIERRKHAFAAAAALAAKERAS